jgi:hypothetical protein
VVDRGGLENRCSLYSGPWVRIPLSPHRAKVRNWGFCLFSMRGFDRGAERRAREQGEQSLSLRTGQKLGIRTFAFFQCVGSNRGAERRAREQGEQSLSLRTGQKLGIRAFAFFYCRGFEPRSGATSSRAGRAIPLSPHRAKVRNWGFCLFSLPGGSNRGAGTPIPSPFTRDG